MPPVKILEPLNEKLRYGRRSYPEEPLLSELLGLCNKSVPSCVYPFDLILLFIFRHYR